ncbi:DUF2884 family protein [Pseudoxanthomonas sp.]|uniref:DUF2884 family protein n=1 Tax=Pseudoxanthomonas sp. TaxID=1871049 RepID=UPI002627852D|nr:DUF2884 family protein [Pseudoxanthomonas sp.]WDS34712.1 MAG: DUF2884 family protein [Pseudoxanthomonas sp.]
MRLACLPLLLSMLCATAAAHAADPSPQPQDGRHDGVKLSSDQCGLSTPFNVLVDSGGVWLYREQGVPKEIFFHGGELSVDRKVRQVTAADAQRLWQMEDQARALMPQVAGIARDAIGITFDALSSVVEALTGSARKARKVDKQRDDALDYINGTLGTGRWDQEVFDDGFEKRIEDAAEEMAGMLARSVLWQTFTGRAEAMEARADRMDAEMDARMEAKSNALEAKAAALCPTVRSLYALQDALEYRYDGQPLRMIEMDDDASNNQKIAAPEAHAQEDNGDHPHTAIDVSR